MLGEAEHITPGVGRRIEPASAIVADYDNISTAPVLHRLACAFFESGGAKFGHLFPFCNERRRDRGSTPWNYI